MPASVLVVDAQRAIRNLLRSYLEHSGLRVLTADSGREALRLVEDTRPDLILLDAGLADLPGEQLVREIRRLCHAPILLLAARALTDRVRGLQHGIEDYVTKPFSQCDVVHQVNAALSRCNGHRQPPSSFGRGRLRIDEAARTVEVSGRVTALTPSEWRLLEAMAACPGRVFTRCELMHRLPGREADGTDRVVDTHIRNLRRKLAADRGGPQVIQTVVGAGYRLAVGRDRPAGHDGPEPDTHLNGKRHTPDTDVPWTSIPVPQIS